MQIKVKKAKHDTTITGKSTNYDWYDDNQTDSFAVSCSLLRSGQRSGEVRSSRRSKLSSDWSKSSHIIKNISYAYFKM